MLLCSRQDHIPSSGSNPGIQQNGSDSAASSIHLETALKALDLGLSPGLPTEDGLKKPDGKSWKQYQTTPATKKEVIAWYRSGRTGNGLFTGYGDLECFEFDDLGIYERFKEASAELGLDDLVERIEAGYSESSPGGGIHWLYRCEKIDGNTKLAERLAPTEEARHKREPLIETRGSGGFIVTAPSNGKVHPSGGAYELLCGGLDTIVTITPDERGSLFSLARSFDEIPVELEPPFRMTEVAGARAHAANEIGFPDQGISPGDDFNARAQLAHIIEPLGWVRAYVNGGVEYWRRPGKDRGWSATWGKTKGFRVFTTSTPLEAKSHSLLNVYCVYRHSGDWRACVKDLVEQGYGTWIDENGQQQTNPHPKNWRSRARSKARKPMSGKQVDAFLDAAGVEPPGSCELDVDFRPAGRSGRGKLTVTVDGRVILMDTININKESDRLRISKRVSEEFPGIAIKTMDDRLLELASQAVDAPTSRGSACTSDSRYQVIDGCICRAIPTPQGEPTWIPICNFGARIVEDVVHDDGMETSRRLAIEGDLDAGEPLERVEVAIEDFGRGDWPLIRWGSHAIVYAGQGNKDHLCAALQVLSGHPPRRVVRTFTGWCKIGEDWAYLHAGGAIGTVGTVESTYIDLPAALQNYRLPAPPEGEERITAVRASLDLVRGLAPDVVTLPLLATTYGAVLPGATIATFVSGKTGSGKTQLAALMQQHFGPEMDASHLPANWSSTGNALEALAFAAKDALMVVDDFCPAGSQADVLRYHKEADRLFRAQGNRSGRQRCRTDGSPRAGKAPRGTILSTGEDIPHGHSLRARLMVVELVSSDAKPARNSLGMFGEPLSHFRGRPGPLERMGVPTVVLRPRGHHMSDERLTTRPRPALQVTEVEGMIQQLRLVQPGGAGRRQAGVPPTVTGGEILLGGPARMAGAAIMDQVDPPKPAVVPSELLQGRDIVIGVVGLQADRLHPPAMNDQEIQDVDRAMPGIVPLPLLDRAGGAAADRHPFQDLTIGHLIGTDDPDSVPGQSLGVGVAPEHLLGSLLEAGIQASGPPVACAMRLQVDVIEDPPDRSGADRRHDAVGDGLVGQILAGPVGDVQPAGHGLQTRQRDDLGALEGGKSRRVVPIGSRAHRRTTPPSHRVDNAGRPSRPWSPRIASGRRWPQSVGRSAIAKTIRARCTWNHGEV